MASHIRFETGKRHFNSFDDVSQLPVPVSISRPFSLPPSQKNESKPINLTLVLPIPQLPAAEPPETPRRTETPIGGAASACGNKKQINESYFASLFPNQSTNSQHLWMSKGWSLHANDEERFLPPCRSLCYRWKASNNPIQYPVNQVLA